MRDKILEQAKREHSPNRRLMALAVEGIFFLILFPYVLITLGGYLNQWLHWPLILYPPVNLILGWLVIVVSWLFAIWSIYAQFTIGRGTPVPLIATQTLIIQPPHSY